MAARLAWRGTGSVEPNPIVGAVIVKDGRIIGQGHHRNYGGPHAEVEAIMDCVRRSENPRGATMYVTLEPCNHTGKTPPCTRALISAGIARVVIARPDPNPAASGGASTMRNAGLAVEFSDASEPARRISDPFVKRILAGLPWVIAKWAQTADGRLITGADEPRWISSAPSRHRVHRLRARVDVVLTGIGTVLADDPLLTARGTRARRTPIRAVIDPKLLTPPASRLVRSAAESPLLLCCSEATMGASPSLVGEFRARGAEILPFPGDADRLDLAAILRFLGEARNAATVMVEAGPGLLDSFFGEGLIDEAIVFTAPAGSGGSQPQRPAGEHAAPDRVRPAGLVLIGEHRSGVDGMRCYRRPSL
jgi:diaminohydroxyphosphoribosylaminopyrimidine deaminase/5-amino-6-(5-phosphoribosylamino)uracil reductase